MPITQRKELTTNFVAYIYRVVTSSCYMYFMIMIIGL